MTFHALLGMALQQTMVVEDTDENTNEMPSGWPLGLGNMNMMRLIVSSGLQQHSSIQRRPSSSHSFSSFSSSTLDTQSAASFFPDTSVSLGRLMGIKPAENRGRFLLTNSTRVEQNDAVPHSIPFGRVQHDDKVSSQRHCFPLLHIFIDKVIRSKSERTP